jgi:D-alanyl-D-alanine carboxypeptidase
MFMAVTVLQLVEEGALELDAPVATWLPDLLPDGDAITVRQLLQHTSGLYDYLEDRRFVIQAYEDPERVFEPQELVEYAIRFPSLFEPGAEDSWDYSSTNYVVLGMLVEEVTGDSLAAALRARIFEPLGLARTFSVPPDHVAGAQSHGYSENTDQTEVALSFAYGTANIVTTIEDLRRFGEALFADELLEPESGELMRTFVGGKGQYDMPELEYGLGLMRNLLPIGPGPDGEERDEEQGRVIGHIGGFGGFRGALWYGVENEILIALDVNQAATDPNDLATRVLDAILTHQGG